MAASKQSCTNELKVTLVVCCCTVTAASLAASRLQNLKYEASTTMDTQINLALLHSQKTNTSSSKCIMPHVPLIAVKAAGGNHELLFIISDPATKSYTVYDYFVSHKISQGPLPDICRIPWPRANNNC